MVSRRSSSTSCNQGLGRRGRRQEGIREGEKNGWKVDRFLVRFPASLEIELLKLAKWEQFCLPAELFSPKARHSVPRRTCSPIVLSCRPLSLPSLPLFCSILVVAIGSPLLLKLGYWSWLVEKLLTVSPAASKCTRTHRSPDVLVFCDLLVGLSVYKNHMNHQFLSL